MDEDWVKLMLQKSPWLSVDFTDSALYHLVSTTIEGPFHAFPGGVIVSGSGSTGLYGTQIVPRVVDSEYDIYGGIVAFNRGADFEGKLCVSPITLELSGKLGFKWRGSDKHTGVDLGPQIFQRWPA